MAAIYTLPLMSSESFDPLEERIAHLERTIESFKNWQKHSWFKRTFRRWKSPEALDVKSVGPEAREQSLTLVKAPEEKKSISPDVSFAMSVCSEQSVFPLEINRSYGLFDSLMIGCQGVRRDGWCSQETNLRLGSTKAGDTILIVWRHTASGNAINLTLSLQNHQDAQVTILPCAFTLRLQVAVDNPITDIILQFAEAFPLNPDDPHVCSACLETVKVDADIKTDSTWSFLTFQSRFSALTSLSPEAFDLLTLVGDCWLSRGQIEQAQWIYDRLWLSNPSNRSDPEKIRAYLHQHAALAENLIRIGRKPDAFELLKVRTQLHTTLAKENGLSETTVYLSPAWTWAYGHMATMHWLIQANLLSENPKKFVLFPYEGKIPNKHLLSHFSPWIEIDSRKETRISLAGVLLGRDISDYTNADYIEISQRWRDAGKPPLLRLTDEDKRSGAELLQQLGVQSGQWFVCLHVRSAGATDGEMTTRNACLETYRDAVGLITRAGGRVIRIGPKLNPPSDIPWIIDYASSPLRSEWGDVFINVACKFFVGTTSGPGTVVEAFGTPSVNTNWYPLCDGPYSGMYICKLLWHEEEDRFLSFSEMLNDQNILLLNQSILRNRKLRLVENTPEDICLLLREVLQVQEGTMTYTDQEVADQAAFAQIIKKVLPHFTARLGRDFLNKYRYLISKAQVGVTSPLSRVLKWQQNGLPSKVHPCKFVDSRVRSC